jgi:hypothetical protein
MKKFGGDMMKKNYLIAVAAAALMLASEVAWAADVSFSGQFRPRFQSSDDFSDLTDSRNYFTTRARLNAKAKVNANTEVFLQLQSVGTWGAANGANSDDSTLNADQGTRVSIGDAASANDRLKDVGFHQAYLTLKNFMGKAVDAKIGRQQVVLDGHRLFGHTGWTDGGQTSDAIRLDHSAGNHTLNYVYIAGTENESNAANDDLNYNVHVFRANTQGVMGGDLTGMFVVVDDNLATGMDDDNTWYTVGARQKGKLGGLDYRVEYYHQFGDGAVRATAANFSGAYATTPNNSASIDRSASMVGLRVGKTFKNAALSPTITLWFDSLSGTDDSNASGDEWGTFDTHYDTGHKFYGFMDLYLSAPGATTGYYGLQDIALKTKWKLSDTNTLKADFHHFQTQTELNDGDSDTLRTNDASFGSNAVGTMEGDLGQEIDLTLVHKYDSNTKVVAGYSHYFATEAFRSLKLGYADANHGDADWMYLMIDTKF